MQLRDTGLESYTDIIFLHRNIENLKKHQNKVDYIITHCEPQNIVSLFSAGLFQPDELTKYFLSLTDMVDFSAWFFGHYHDNRKLLDRYFLLYEQIIRIL